VLLVFIFHSLYNERREKQAAAQQTFVFHKPLTNESPAKAGSKARMRGIREWTRAQGKTSGCAADICFSRAINERIACVSRQ